MAITYHAGRRIQGATSDYGKSWLFTNGRATGSFQMLPTGTSAFTLMVWIKPLNFSSSHTVLRSGSADDSISFYSNTTGIRFTGSAGTVEIADNTTSGWTHIAIARNGSGTDYLYVNGVASSSTASTGSKTIPSISDWHIGDRHENDEEWGGNIGQWLVYTDQKSLSEIQAVYNNGSGTFSPSTTNLQTHYNFEQTGSTLTDQEGSNNCTASGTITKDQIGFNGKPTNVQVGSRFEETDTRKMYHYADLTYGGFPKFWAEEGVAIGTYPPTRGVWASGYTNTPSNQPLNTMDYVTLASSGSTNTATDFGDLTGSRASSSGASSYTRGVIAGGSPSIANIEFITIMTKSNASNFGDLTVARENVASLTDRSRGMWIAGGNNNSNVIDYVTISTQANATSFGTLSTARRLAQGVNDATIGLVAGGYISSAVSSVLKFTIQTLGNGTDFGNLSSNRYNVATVSSQTRGIWAGGQAGVNTDMDYRTIAGTSATATVFGSLGTAQTGANGNSDLTRGVIAGGWVTSLMQVMTIDTGSGGATTFGNLSLARDHPAGGLEG